MQLFILFLTYILLKIFSLLYLLILLILVFLILFSISLWILSYFSLASSSLWIFLFLSIKRLKWLLFIYTKYIVLNGLSDWDSKTFKRLNSLMFLVYTAIFIFSIVAAEEISKSPAQFPFLEILLIKISYLVLYSSLLSFSILSKKIFR